MIKAHNYDLFYPDIKAYFNDFHNTKINIYQDSLSRSIVIVNLDNELSYVIDLN